VRQSYSKKKVVGVSREGGVKGELRRNHGGVLRKGIPARRGEKTKDSVQKLKDQLANIACRKNTRGWPKVKTLIEKKGSRGGGWKGAGACTPANSSRWEMPNREPAVHKISSPN